MLGTALVVFGAVGSVLPWFVEREEEFKERDRRDIDMVTRALTGKLASDPRGEIEEVVLDKYTELPPDPAFGGKPVLVTSDEFVWWVTEGAASPAKHAKKLRGILHKQKQRRREDGSCGAR